MTTQFANAQYQEIIDLHTESKKISVVGIHTPASQTPMRMLSGFWSQFRKFRYNGCSLALVPVAQLPADPLQVSYGAGETIDPRDLTNPILFKGCHGEHLNEILDALYTSTVGSDEVSRQFGDSVDHNMFNRDAVGGSELYESMYYRALTDNTWAKAHPMRGFRKNGLHPMMYMVGTTHQMSNHPDNVGIGALTPYVRKGDDVFGEFDDTVSPVMAGDMGTPGSQSSNVAVGRPPGIPTFDSSALKMKYGLNATNLGFYTPRLARLGWMDTYNVMQPITPSSVESEVLTGDAKGDAQKIMAMYQGRRVQNSVPKLFMGMIMFAPAYKTELHYRLILTHSFSFKGFQGASSFVDLYTANYQNMTATEPTKGAAEIPVETEVTDYGEFELDRSD